MQRFKDFTKKSGKVASAILSAAMVTSMVAGTNVVYAATETTEATTDVTGQTTIQSDQEAVRAAKADLEAALKDLPVTRGLTEDDVKVGVIESTADLTETDLNDGNGLLDGYKHKALKDFYKPAHDIMTQYGVVIEDGKFDANDSKAATLTKSGTLTVTFDIRRTENAKDKVTARVQYTIPSLTDRQKAAEAAVQNALNEYKEKVNNTTTREDLEKVAKDALGAKGGKYESIPLYEDFNTEDGVKAKLLDKDLAELNTKGYLEAEVTAKQKDVDNNAAEARTVFTVNTPSNQERMDAAMTAAKDYLAKDARYLNGELNHDDATTGAAFAAGLQAYLANPTVGFDDIKVNMNKTDSDGNPVDKFIVNDPATQNEDGKATVTFTLDTTDDYFTDAQGGEVGIPAEQKASATAENVSLVLASDETTAKKALADLKAAAEKVDVADLDDGDAYDEDYTAEYNKKFLKNLNNALEPYRLDAAKIVTGTSIVPTGATFDNKNKGTEISSNDTNVSPMTLSNFNNIYNNLNMSKLPTVAFTAKDASAGKDGKPKTELFVSIKTDYTGANEEGFVQEETQTATVDYTIDSAQTVVDKAAAAVQAALDAMNVTNDTTDADVLKVVEDAIKDYSGVSAKVVKFDKHDATADKEGTAEIVVELTDKKNGITKEAKANKKFAFYCNTFVEKDGKKYYYGKDGKLATTDKGYFLQGTDSPDGYTYFIQNDGSVMQDRLTYHPDGEHVIYFDKDGHEVFDAFVNVKKDVQGQDVDYIGYFDTFGYAYVNKTTYGNGEGAYAKDALFYINDYGVLENKGWFGNAAGEIGYAAPNGTLTTSQWSLDQFGRKVYFQANGFLAKGLMTDGVKYYQLDENDGHLVGEF